MANETVMQITEEGLQTLKDEYYRLIHTDREIVKAELKEARSQGDLSENADYDAAREKQAQIESRISYLDDLLTNQKYELITKKKGSRSKTVTVGSTVTIKFLDNNTEEKYQILGSTEADPLNGIISNETPLAKAILDHKVGEVCEVSAKVPYQVEILATK